MDPDKDTEAQRGPLIITSSTTVKEVMGQEARLEVPSPDPLTRLCWLPEPVPLCCQEVGLVLFSEVPKLTPAPHPTILD